MTSETKNVVGVRFKRAGRVNYFEAGGLTLDVRDYVVVDTERGIELARVVIAPYQVLASEITEPLKPVLRRATEDDLGRQEEVRRKEEEVLAKCNELVKKFNLPMKLRGVEGNLPKNRFTIFFSAEGRIDFRDLVRELSTAVKARVELRQIGARDETKLMGGYGRCGCPLCCATFLTEFSPLSIKMAKEQGLSLNPLKISGVCGRLLCCLGYEIELYRKAREKLPPAGQEVTTPLGPAKVVEVSPLKETVMVQLESAAMVELPLTQIGLSATPEKPEKAEG